MRLYNVRVLEGTGLSQPRHVDLEVAEGERDASGLILSPGWVDLHAHLRDPGFPDKETLVTGTASAAFGGFTHVVAMANTNPVTDDPVLLARQVARARELPIRVSFAVAVTKKLDGKDLTDATALRDSGAVALSDDGRHAMDLQTLRRALAGAAEASLPVFVHAQREELGASVEAERRGVGEALEALAQVPNAQLHVQHVSTSAAVQLISDAKRAGLPVTAEVTPHHLALTSQDAMAMGPRGNVSPPLRGPGDREAVMTALLDGTIDVIATDHAPHEAAAKAVGANGFHGFETAVGVLLTLGIDWTVLYRACVKRPMEILGQPIFPPPAGEASLFPPQRAEASLFPPPCGEGQGGGSRERGGNWILIDPDLEWTVDPSTFRSRGRNTPFAGRRLKGRAVMTICDGQVLFERMVQRV
jgi:dihydroorotase